MKRCVPLPFSIALCAAVGATQGSGAPPPVAPLPEGVKAVWNPAKAVRQTTPTRERISINGLWRWQPADSDADAVPADGWGHFKVPGCWPGITDYMQKDSQTVHAHPAWEDRDLRGLTAAWYQREIAIPRAWGGRRIAIRAEYLNSLATVYLDGRRAGAMRFPGGEVDLSAVCRPGGTHVLTLLVVALPLEGVMLSETDTAAARDVRGPVARRGLCGDVQLASAPAGARIRDVRVETSVRRWRITLDVGVEDLGPGAAYRLGARIIDDGRTVKAFASEVFTGTGREPRRIAFSAPWRPAALWDVHTPGNLYELHVSLLDAGGNAVDVFHPVSFGFREFWIDGRDFILNGSRIFLAAVPLDNAQIGAALACYAGARESLERLKGFGVRLVFTHNYGCRPGSHLSFAEILKAADDVGMLVSLSQPHFGDYRWDAPDAEASNGYARHAAFYVGAAGNHPSVVMYGMSHNATGYSEDMNPDMIDGRRDPRTTSWSRNNAARARRAEAIVRRLDPGRIVYHHASGHLGSMHTSNFYANFVPPQELAEWFAHWSAAGVKPVFLCEYGAPFSWDWTMYRGWYRGEREFGNARVPWEFCLAEWNAQFFGDRAYRIGEAEKANLRWEARQFRAGRTWHRWDYPHAVGSNVFQLRQSVFAMYFTDAWRAHRTWGVSALCPWNHGHYWRLRDGVDRRRKPLAVQWEGLQRPGFSPDFIDRRYERMDLAFARSDWRPTAAARALMRNNRPLLAYIAGKPSRFTSKDHNVRAGETVRKQIIIINDSREAVTCDCEWSLALPRPITGRGHARLGAGRQVRLPVRCDLPPTLAEGPHVLRVKVAFSTGEVQEDAFAFHIVPPAPVPRVPGAMALYDPRGETRALLESMGVDARPVEAGAHLSPYRVLIVGKGALTVDGPAPDLRRVRDGLKVIVFEQTAEALERRLGFRVAEYGLRWVFPRIPDHPLLAGLGEENLRDWRGEATILPPRLSYHLEPRHGPMVRWCDIPVPRLWRCGCYGNVASVLIEKPACGDFLPILDGGFSLQYSPLMEFREGVGMVLFCQMDVTGRTESDPAAERLVGNILRYVNAWEPAPRRGVVYVGDPAGRSHLEAAGATLEGYEGGALSTDRVLVVGPAGGLGLSGHAAAIADWLEAGGHLLAIGLDETEANAFLPFTLRTREEEHIAAYFPPEGMGSLLAGIGPADVHNREPRDLPLVTGGASPVGNGVLAQAREHAVVFCQLAPWRFDPKRQNTKRVFRRASFLLSRLLGNMGAAGATPLLDRFHRPVPTAREEKRWLHGLYLDVPEEWDDPYRFFRW